MQIDPDTTLLFGLLVKLVLGVLFLIFWFKERPASAWFAWWAATFLFGSGAALALLLREVGNEFLVFGTGITCLIIAFGCCWQGTRAFDKRRPVWFPLLLAPSIWIVACLVPGFVENAPYRVVLSSLVVAPLMAMSAVECWRGRQEPLQSRGPVIILFATLALFFASRIPFVNLLPFPFGGLPAEDSWIAAFNLIVFCHALMLTVLIVAMSKERLELEQRTNAQTDPLTGALNRRAFMSRGARLAQRHKYEKAPLCLLFLDLDHFKALNDRLGHSGGDDVLVKFVVVVHANIRPTDFLFRMGGEEFCCLLPHTRPEQARLVAERIRQQFELATIDVAGTPVQATVSLGIASTETFGYDLDTLMRKADMAVYAAKRQGRNRVVVATADNTEAAGARASLVDGCVQPAA